MNMRCTLREMYDKTYWFSDEDAWKLFRLAAFAEAVTWTLLISSIVARNMSVTGGDIAVSISGTVHGTMLLVYITLIVVLSRSMEWGCGVSRADLQREIYHLLRLDLSGLLACIARKTQ